MFQHNRILCFGTAAVLALATVLPAFADDPAEAQQLYQQAQELAKGQKLDEAVAAIKKAIGLAPSNDLYLATASDLELKAGKFKDGVEHALQAIKLNDKVGAYYVLVAANAVGDQDLDRAREYCDLVLKREKEFGPGPCKDVRMLQDLVTPKTYTLFWNLDPQHGQAVRGVLAVALPKGELPYQTVTYEVTGAKGQRLVKGEVNDVLYLVPQGTGTMALTTKVTVEPHSYKSELAKATTKRLPDDVKAFLGPCQTIDPKSAALKKVAADLKADNSADTVRNILAWMKKNVEYKLEKTNILELDFKTVDEILDRGHAECRGYAMLFTALCRAADVPSRPIWGLERVAATQDQRFGDIASHNWSEVYISGCGWVPVDPQRPETFGCLPTSCIRIFMDAKKSSNSTELLPMFNLVSMNGGKLRFEEARATESERKP